MTTYLIIRHDDMRPHEPQLHCVRAELLADVLDKCRASSSWSNIFELAKDEAAPPYNSFGGMQLKFVASIRPTFYIKTLLLFVANELRGASDETIDQALAIAVELFDAKKGALKEKSPL